MEIRFPQTILYEVPADVPVADVIEALLGAERLLLDIGPLLERLVPDLEAQVRVYVREISKSSLREVLFTALFLTYQKDLNKEVPDIINKMFGVDVSEHSAIASFNIVCRVAILRCRVRFSISEQNDHNISFE